MQGVVVKNNSSKPGIAKRYKQVGLVIIKEKEGK